MGFLSSIGSSFGGLLNDFTGATSAGKQSQKYSLEAMKLNNKYQKEFAQNAHQWEIKDLKAAGLNPVLSANGGATASGGGISSGSVSSSGLNPIETAIGAWNGYEQARNTGADTNRKNAETENIDADTLLKHYQTLTEIEKGKLTKTQREEIEAEKLTIIKTLGPKIKQIEAETKYTNERARGHTESRTISNNVHGLSFGTGTNTSISSTH